MSANGYYPPSFSDPTQAIAQITHTAHLEQENRRLQERIAQLERDAERKQFENLHDEVRNLRFLLKGRPNPQPHYKSTQREFHPQPRGKRGGRGRGGRGRGRGDGVVANQANPPSGPEQLIAQLNVQEN